MDDNKVSFVAYSALFRAVNNSMFINDKLSNQVFRLYENKTGNVLKIYNEKRLK